MKERVLLVVVGEDHRDPAVCSTLARIVKMISSKRKHYKHEILFCDEAGDSDSNQDLAQIIKQAEIEYKMQEVLFTLPAFKKYLDTRPNLKSPFVDPKHYNNVSQDFYRVILEQLTPNVTPKGILNLFEPLTLEMIGMKVFSKQWNILYPTLNKEEIAYRGIDLQRIYLERVSDDRKAGHMQGKEEVKEFFSQRRAYEWSKQRNIDMAECIMKRIQDIKRNSIVCLCRVGAAHVDPLVDYLRVIGSKKSIELTIVSGIILSHYTKDTADIRACISPVYIAEEEDDGSFVSLDFEIEFFREHKKFLNSLSRGAEEVIVSPIPDKNLKFIIFDTEKDKLEILKKLDAQDIKIVDEKILFCLTPEILSKDDRNSLGLAKKKISEKDENQFRLKKSLLEQVTGFTIVDSGKEDSFFTCTVIFDVKTLGSTLQRIYDAPMTFRLEREAVTSLEVSKAP